MKMGKIKLSLGMLVLTLVLLSGISVVMAQEIGQGEKFEIIKPVEKENPELGIELFRAILILIAFGLLIISIFVLIIKFASRIEGSNKPVWIGAAIGFLIGLLGFLTAGIPSYPIFFLLTSYPIFFLLSFFVIDVWNSLYISLILAPFVYSIIGVLIGVIIKIKLKNKND